MTEATPDRVEQFLTYAARDRMRSPHTIRRYRETLHSLTAIADPATADVETIQVWWDLRIERDGGKARSPASRSNELACLRSFYRWMTRNDYRPDDPTRRQDFLKPDNHVPRPIGEHDLSRLLGELTKDAPDLRRAFALGAYAGLRVSEAADLDWADIDLESHRLYVRGKGRKERVIGLSPILTDKILPNTGGNVVTAGDVPYAGATLQRKTNRVMARAGISHSFHDLRKRGATLSLARGMNPEAIRQVFGWSSMQTVTHYAVVGSEELDKIAEAMT